MMPRATPPLEHRILCRLSLGTLVYDHGQRDSWPPRTAKAIGREVGASAREVIQAMASLRRQGFVQVTYATGRGYQLTSKACPTAKRVCPSRPREGDGWYYKGGCG